jgi:hypothetical protein
VQGQIGSPERPLQKLAGVADGINRRTDGMERADASLLSATRRLCYSLPYYFAMAFRDPAEAQGS